MGRPCPGLLCFLVFLSTFVLLASSQSSPDAASMEALKSSLKLSGEVDWSDPNPCEWDGVQCGPDHRVTRIQVVNKNVGGTLPPDLRNLTSLVVLEFMSNSLSGPIPSLAGLSALQEVNLHHNKFTSIPSDFFTGLTSLQSVYLDYNPLSSWKIPDSLKDATSLKDFSATQCNISGKIPDFFDSQTFPSLTTLHLAFNNLEGELPASLAGSTIKSLWLNGQSPKLNGTIAVLQNMTSLTEVWLHGNKFTGPIPDVSGLESLQNFSVRDNQLTGIVPPSLLSLQSLLVVNLTNNQLQGPTPKFEARGVKVDMNLGSNSFCLDDPGVDCDPRVSILLSIAEPLGYPVRFAENWKGNDPCKNWIGITCSGGNITVINFKNMGVSGTISPSFAKLTSLQTINLAQNNLTGKIPQELAALPNLRTLDVSDNKLYGKVPDFKNAVAKTEGNANIGKDAPPDTGKGGSPDSGSGKGGGGGSSGDSNNKSSTGKIVGSVVGGVAGLCFVGLAIFLFSNRRRKNFSKVQSPNAVVVHPQHSGDDQGVKITIAASNANAGGGSETYSHGSSGPSDIHVVEAGNMVISIQVLKSVTNNFGEENILGRGGFGTVYKGELHDGTKIAVKRMEASVVSDKGLAEFKSEIAVLTKVRHRNLVALLGYCLDGNERLLVYEYMPQGTLSKHLFHWKEEGLKPLEWTRRLTIALDVARGVEYLHTLAHQSFIHRDLKPSNILLGDDMRAKVADFGLVRLAPDGKHSIETRLAGTFGYLAPEYAVTGRVTTKVDIFSFGVILMEIITGRKALDDTQPEDSMHLVTWFRRMSMNKDSFRGTVDRTIELDDDTLASVGKVSELAGHCTAREPYQRPDMAHVVNVLSSLVDQWKPSEPDPDDMYGIDYDMPLPQVVKKWQAFEGSSSVDDSSSSFFDSRENTQTSIPTRPSGFAESFASSDGR